MNIGDYAKRNKAFLIVGLLAIIILVGLGLRYRTTTTIQPSAATTPTPQIAGQSATLTPIASPSAMISSAGCHVTLADPTNPQSVLPDPNCTPGGTNPAVTQATIRTTICTHGYTTTVRDEHPTSYYEKLKVVDVGLYGYKDTNVKDYEEDHFIPLELGGNNNQANLWAEFDKGVIPNEKDKVETYLKKQVCSNVISLASAQKEITTNWYNVYLGLYPPQVPVPTLK